EMDEAKKIGDRSVILLENNIDIEKLRNDINWLLQAAANEQDVFGYVIITIEKKICGNEPSYGFCRNINVVNSLNEYPPQTGFAPH
ncbi:hypothetical protein EBS02_10575, partial [bacterium]|nr:hypothetical protein [bacterium]